MKRIGDILTRNKTRVPVEDGTLYKQVTVRMNYKGVVLRGTQYGATIGTKDQFAVSAGQFLLSKIDARNGAFGIIPEELEGAIITNSFLAFDINEQEVEPDFFNVFLQSPVFLDACIKASKGTTNRKPVDEDFFLNYEVNLPPLREQHRLIERINKGQNGIAIAQHEITHQATLLAQLQQAILQEAIQGKLTADWRAAHPQTEPASQLLHRIQAEKARLIAAKQLRPEKPLPKITPAEIPFEIPKTWEWCRLNQTVSFSNGDRSTNYPSGNDLKASGVPFINSKSIHDGIVDLKQKDIQYITEAKFDSLGGGKFKPYDIIMVLRGSGRGKSGILFDDNSLLTGFINAQLIIIRGVADFEPKYFRTFLESSFFFAQIDDVVGGSAQPHISGENLKTVLLPLPPLAEQAVIVARVETLLGNSRLLAAEIAHTRTHAAHLLQAVLKEAFKPAS